MPERQTRRYPDHPGYARGVVTSIEAADRIAGAAPSLRSKILQHAFDMGSVGITSDEVEQFFDMPHTTASARICELRLFGDLVRTGRKRMTRFGRRAFVLVVKELAKPQRQKRKVHRYVKRKYNSRAVVSELDTLICGALRRGPPLTCQGIEKKIMRLHQAVSGNLRHLVERGVIERSGLYGWTESGRRAIKWRLRL